MTHTLGAGTLAPAPEHARDLQARLYRDIGISAVAAALRFTTQPDPVSRPMAKPAEPAHMTKSIAA